MTVVTETIKTSGVQRKGDISKFHFVNQINDKKDYYELVHGENWQTRISKEIYRIAFITSD